MRERSACQNSRRTTRQPSLTQGFEGTDGLGVLDDLPPIDDALRTEELVGTTDERPDEQPRRIGAALAADLAQARSCALKNDCTSASFACGCEKVSLSTICSE